MTHIEMAAIDAAASLLSLGLDAEEEPGELRALAESAAYNAARRAGASPLHAAEVSQQVTAEMTWLGSMLAITTS